MQSLHNLIQLRWYAAFGVLSLFLLADYFLAKPVWPFGYVLLFVFFAINVTLSFFEKRLAGFVKEKLPAALMVFDLAYLTVLLFYNGGAHNPFAILFVVLCAVAAMNFSKAHLIFTVFISLCCLGIIYSGDNYTHHHDVYDLHLQGMWFANSITVIVISWFIFSLRLKTENIALQNQKNQHILFQIERIESMGRMIASAAHQLNTPLATLQLGISELSSCQNDLTEKDKKIWLDDLQKAVNQIAELIQRLKPDDTQNTQQNQKIDLCQSLQMMLNQWAESRDVKLLLHTKLSELIVSAFTFFEIHSAVQAVLENSYEAKKTEKKLVIDFSIFAEDDLVYISIKDNGIGMSDDVLSRAVEPLFTTKKKGTGLGLYFAHQITRKYGGKLDFQSKEGDGTSVVLTFHKRCL